MDVIFIDCPENLPVPRLSKPPHVVPSWNADPDDEALQLMCSFAPEHLHDDGCIMLFYSYSMKSKENIARVCEAYNLVKKKEWMGMNCMHLTSTIDNAKTVTSADIPWLPCTIHNALHSMRCNGLVLWMVQTQKFRVTFLVKDLGSKGKCKFSFKAIATMMKAGVNVGTDDMLMNYTHANDMAMNGDTP